jgi:hypothetical protein
MKNIIKLLGIIALILVIGFSMTACDTNDSDVNGENVNDEDVNGDGGAQTGLYLGIIGFNENITPKEISILTDSNKGQFQTFISNLEMKPATGLYYAVEKAIEKLQAATLPNDLVNVSLVTFTDGLDNASTMLNTTYSSRDQYRDDLSNRITNTKIKNLPINAYSIGIRGGDVVDIPAFQAGLRSLASRSSNSYEVTSMADVNSTFRTIADSLYNESQSQTIRLRIPGGYESGTKIRFTFDSVTDTTVDTSTLYIEGVYNVSGSVRSLQSIVYQGMNSNSGTTVTGSVSGVYVTFTFANVSATSGGNVSTDNVKVWSYITSQTRWQPDVEFGQTGDTETIVERKSAVIMLVLDCTSSLDAGGVNGFQDMKNAANSFIDILLGGGGNNPGGSNPNSVNATNLTANVWVNGNITSSNREQWFRFTATANTHYIHVSFGTLDDLYVQVYQNNNSLGTVNLYDSFRSAYINNTTPGLVYHVKVYPYYSSDYGTYRIAMNTSTTAPPQ